MKKELLNKLNKSLNELISDLSNNNDYKKIIECIGKKEDLKLYDLSYGLYDNEEYKNLTDKEKNNLFNIFCDDSYRVFDEWIQEEKLYIDFKYIGHTSTFFVIPKRGIDYNDIYDFANSDLIGKIFLLLDEYINNELCMYYGLSSFFEIEKNQIVNIDSYLFDFLRDYNITLDECIKDFKQFIIDYFEDVKKVYDYIDDFKNNQCEYFNEYYNDFWLQNNLLWML